MAVADKSSDRLLSTLLRAMAVAGVVETRDGWWHTDEIRSAFNARVGPACGRTILRYLHSLHEAGVLDRRVGTRYREYSWRYAGRNQPLF